MKFLNATLYKVPFDNSYINVIDYHNYEPKVGVLNGYERSDTEYRIKFIRHAYFKDRSKLVIYDSNSAYKSVKIDGDRITVSIAGNFENVSDYNYIIFDTKDNETPCLSTKLFCFIISATSNNDSTNPSTTIIAEVDHWTNNVVSMTFNTPTQFEEYAHLEINSLLHNIVDDRLPSDFNTNNEISYLFEDCVIWIRVEYDKSHLPVPNSFAGCFLDAASTSSVFFYIPYTYIRRVGDDLTGKPIIGIIKRDNTIELDFTAFLASRSYFTWLNNQYTKGVSLTIFTPMGVFKQSEYIRDVNNSFYL